MKLLTNICRVIVGLLFIISGLIKANDPIGFSYKLEEYFTVFELPLLIPMALWIAILICAAEIVLGVALLIGCRIKLTAWLLLLMIVFFTFLTFYSAYYNKVTDCGCFGDALKLTPWQSFSKDIVLSILIIIILFGMKYIRPLFKPKTGDRIVIASSILCIGFSIYCYFYLPVKDFLPYREGANIQEMMTLPPGAKQDIYENRLTYKNLKTGELKDFDDKNMPWQDTLNWKFVSTKSTLIQKGDKPAIHDFRMVDSQGNDLTDLLFEKDEFKLVIVEYELDKAWKGDVQEKLSKLTHDVIERNKMQVFALTATPLGQAEAFRHEVQGEYTFYNCDATALKTIIRSNPGVLLMKKNVIIKKWSAFNFPDYHDLMRYCE